MSKYNPLSERLAAHEGPEWQASFAEIEEVLGFPLPKGARAGRAWWASADKPHARSWSQHGFDVEVDHASGQVTFRRGGSQSGAAAAGPAAMDAGPGEVGGGAIEPLLTDVAPEPVPAAAPVQSGRKVPSAGVAALVAGGVALAAGLGTVLLRTLGRRR
jgi:hypothetical protein